MAASAPSALTPARLLNGLMILTTVMLVAFLGFSALEGRPEPGLWALAVVMAGAALVRARRPSLERTATAAFAAASTAASIVAAASGLSLSLLFIAEVFISAVLGPAAAWTYLLGMAVGVALVDQWAQPTMTFASLAYEATMAACLFGVAMVIGVLIRNLRVSLETTAQLLAERAAAHRELELMHQRLRASVEKEKDLVVAEERARAARDLHDGLGQRLTLLRMSLDYALRVRHSQQEPAWQEIAAARDTARAALAEMRRWVRALHPVTVSGLDPREALEAIAESFRGTGFEVGVRIGSPARMLSEDESIYLYRLVQEGLTNSLRHGRATRAELFVDLGTSCLIELSDNGQSGQPDGAEPVEGFGLRSLRERAQLLGGTLSASYQPTGFLLRAQLPQHSRTEPDQWQESAA